MAFTNWATKRHTDLPCTLWSCLRRILAALVPRALVLSDVGGLCSAWSAGGIPILAPSLVWHEIESSGHKVPPMSWDTTSDSIAARIAVSLAADRLILLQSAPLSPGTNRGDAARLGLVDPIFPVAARSLARVEYVNLRRCRRTSAFANMRTHHVSTAARFCRSARSEPVTDISATAVATRLLHDGRVNDRRAAARRERVLVCPQEVAKWLDDGVFYLVSPLDTANMTEVELTEEQETMLTWLDRNQIQHVRVVE